MPARLPRLTLYTGPTCSLCDIAKATLAQVRKSRPFELQYVNIQDPGQERWRRKYVYWIPALHVEGREVLKGRWGDSELESAPSGPNGWMFWPDAQGTGASEIEWRPFMARYEHVYERVSNFDGGLGDVPEEVPDGSFGLSRCFNCGLSEHTVRSCPEPLNHPLIALSRALFQFLHQSNGSEPDRFHVAEDWKLQRLRWLEDFEPGAIHSGALREALDLPEGGEAPWLYNMLEWGYPPGWVSEEDPRELMFKRIVSGGTTEADDDDLGEFSIFGEDGDEEVLNLHPSFASQASDYNLINCATPSKDDADTLSRCDGENGSLLLKSSPAVRHWAMYQTSLFSSDLLPVYNRRPLPPLDDDIPRAATARPRSEDRQGCDLESSNVPIEHPWRHPDAFSAFGPVGWTKAYERILARRAQIEQECQKVSPCIYPRNRGPKPTVGTADSTATYSSSLSLDNNIDDDDDDMDLSD